MDDKTKSIVAHLTLIGWVIALVMNQGAEKGPQTSYYLRQMLGLLILSLLGWLITIAHLPIFIYYIWIILVFILWIMSIVAAAGGTQKPVPVVGEMFQQWFKGIS